jgi:phage tail sheath gpL-like
VSDALFRANLIAHYRQLEAEGHVQNSDAFAEHVVVEKDPVITSRVNILYPDELIDQLRVMAFLIQPRHY